MFASCVPFERAGRFGRATLARRAKGARWLAKLSRARAESWERGLNLGGREERGHTSKQPSQGSAARTRDMRACLIYNSDSSAAAAADPRAFARLATRVMGSRPLECSVKSVLFTFAVVVFDKERRTKNNNNGK